MAYYGRAMAKAQALSNTVNHNPKLDDIFDEITGS